MGWNRALLLLPCVIAALLAGYAGTSHAQSLDEGIPWMCGNPVDAVGLPVCDRYFEEYRRRMATGSQRTVGADIAVPVFRVAPPPPLTQGSGTFQIRGLVGDNGSPPRLKIDGAAAPLFQPSGSDPAVATHTMAFRINVPTDAPDGSVVSSG